MLHTDRVVVPHLFLATDIGMTASSVATAIVLGTIVLQVETKMAQITTTVATKNEMRHSAPSIPPSNPCLEEGKGKGNEGEGGGHCRGRWW